ncbi:MAG: carbohydrate kinase family protein [Methanobrevibacter arboriphilus]|uniref:Carbohydrate kinase family protein n=1 Tax=Methanobrevibacter arboriphilus TaxID=39441 RepID=A0A843APV1_METAZ|nr:carbohydrate kinase family protein [Methanobrevibacter arboriphilus]MBF4469528.1 carbohydrate kinase family protein [Methanobrevibacter arboriphilus]
MSILDNNIPVDVIGFGALNLDKMYYVNDIACHDEESYIKDFDSNPGGSAANTIIGLSRLGVSTSYIGKIADDEEGEMIELNLISEGVFVNNLIESEKGNSGKVMGFIDENGQRALYVDSGVNDEITIGEINIENIKNTKIIHYSSFFGNSFNTQLELLDYIPDSVVLSLDPGMFYAKKNIKELKKLLNRTNILLINENELKLLFKDYYLEINGLKGSDNESTGVDTSLSFKNIARIVIKDGIEIIVVKRGEKSVFAINNQNEEVEVPVFKTDVIDTTAAGDSFNAGFLYSFLKGYSLHKSCLIGNWVASKCVENICTVGLPDKSQLEDFEKSIGTNI